MASIERRTPLAGAFFKRILSLLLASFLRLSPPTRRMAEPGTVLVDVGAAHLAGEKSVIDLLEKRGDTVERIQ